VQLTCIEKEVSKIATMLSILAPTSISRLVMVLVIRSNALFPLSRQPCSQYQVAGKSGRVMGNIGYMLWK
jgi:hypothetical protein